MISFCNYHYWGCGPCPTPIFCILCRICPFPMSPECPWLDVGNTTSDLTHRKWVKLFYDICSYFSIHFMIITNRYKSKRMEKVYSVYNNITTIDVKVSKKVLPQFSVDRCLLSQEILKAMGSLRTLLSWAVDLEVCSMDQNRRFLFLDSFSDDHSFSTRSLDYQGM